MIHRLPLRILARPLLGAALAAAMAAGPSAFAQGLRPSMELGASRGSSAPQVRIGAVPPAGPRPADYIVAVVNSEPITNNEVRSRVVRMEQQLSAQGGALPTREQLAKQVLERMISEKSQLQAGREAGVRVDEASVDLAEQSVARQNQIDVGELRRRIAAEGLPLSQFRDDLRNQIMLQRTREREVEPRVRVSDLDVDQFIREQQGNPDASNLEINLGQVLVAVPENATPEQVSRLQAKAEGIAEQARKGDDFAALARQNSDGPERDAGGAMGLRAAERYPEAFVEATRTLRAGAVAGPLRTGAGFHVLKVLDKHQAGLPGVTVTQNHARHILLRVGPSMSESAAVERLNELKRRVESGRDDFAVLAREFSQDGSARQGGDLGWSNPGMFVPEFEQAIDALQPGQIADPMVSRFGVHLIQLMERREATLSQLEQRDIARSMVREKKLEEAYARWVQDTRGRAYVEYREAPSI